jgi:hypothetical protein
MTTFLFRNDAKHPVRPEGVGLSCFMRDASTVTRLATPNRGGIVIRVDSDGVWVHFKVNTFVRKPIGKLRIGGRVGKVMAVRAMPAREWADLWGHGKR